MTVVIQTPVPQIAFSKNPIWITLQSDDFNAVVPAYSVNYLEFTGAVADGDVKSLTWTGGAAAMTAKAAPDDSGLQFPTGTGDFAYVQSILTWFQGNPFLDRAYIITADNSTVYPRLIFTAKTKSSDFDMGAAAGVGVITAGASDAPKANFRHHLQLWISNAAGTGYDLAHSANIPLDVPTAGLTSSDIHELLHAFLDPDYPELTDMAKQCMASIRPWYFKYAQFFGTDPSIRRLYKSDSFVINKGGLGKQASAVRDIYSELQVNPGDQSTWKLLRQGSKNKLISKQQPEWLTYINLTTAAQNIQLEVTIHNADTSEKTFTTTASIAADPGQKFQFQCGFTQLGITGRQAAGKVPTYYTCRIKGDAGYLSAEYAYVIDNNYEEWPRCFVYENSYGAYQTIFTTGKGQAEFDRSKSDVQLAVDQRTAAITGESLETNIFYQDKFTVNYGYSRATPRLLALLRDLFASHSIFLYDTGKLIPIGISTKNVKDAADSINVYASGFEYYPKYQEELFSEEPYQEDLSVVDLLIDAGVTPVVVPVPPEPPVELVNGVIVVEFADPHLSIVGGLLTYTAPFWLAGKINYRIDSTQIANYFRTGEVIYNPAGAFTIQLPGFELNSGEQLLIHPFILKPDSL